MIDQCSGQTGKRDILWLTAVDIQRTGLQMTAVDSQHTGLQMTVADIQRFLFRMRET